ncbi:hypothetical protein QQX98_003153 [Neonectria punicea]|uniref:Aminoglycoside phosphotransferase domain-containing protein n=1 Tax=Neonectria punicea TaxID=979145 RepID=A0ABR1HF58_9HYPO
MPPVAASKMMASLENTASAKFHGLKWVSNLWGSEPRWTVQPDEATIKRTIQSTLQLSDSCEISFLGQGTFNKTYVIKASEKEIVARVTLPVRRNTSLPVPEIPAYDATRSKLIEFEWIAMTRIPGNPLADVWRDIDFAHKEQLVRQLARFSSDTFCNQLHGIGSIFLVHEAVVGISSSPDSESAKTILQPQQSIGSLLTTNEKVRDSSEPGRITSADFIWDDRIQKDIPRGPFESSRDWLAARLTIAKMICQERLTKARPSITDQGIKIYIASETESTTEGHIELAKDTTNEHNEKEQSDEQEEEEEDEEEMMTTSMTLRSSSPPWTSFPGSETVSTNSSLRLALDLNRQ